MREMDAFEQAYKNGYAAGLKAAEEKIVRCKDCKHYECDEDFGGTFCDICGGLTEPDALDFCSYGERRANNAD